MSDKIRRGSWIVTIPLAAAAAAYVVLVFLPARREIGDAREELQEKREFILRANTAATALPDAQKELSEAEAYTEAWRQRAPRREHLSAIYGSIHELTEAAGATTSRFDPEPIIRHDRICQIPLAIGLSCASDAEHGGSFAQICRFLQELETLAPEIWIRDMQIDKVDSESGNVECELSLVVFADNRDDSDYVVESK